MSYFDNDTCFFKGFTRAVEKTCAEISTQKRKTKTEKNALKRRRKRDKKTSAGALRVQAAVEEFLSVVNLFSDDLPFTVDDVNIVPSLTADDK